METSVSFSPIRGKIELEGKTEYKFQVVNDWCVLRMVSTCDDRGLC